jgi:hypothetical protein
MTGFNFNKGERFCYLCHYDHIFTGARSVLFVWFWPFFPWVWSWLRNLFFFFMFSSAHSKWLYTVLIFLWNHSDINCVLLENRWIFSDLPNPSSCTMALGSTQPLTETSTRNISGGGKGQLAHKADNLTAICEPIVWRKCGSLDVFTACYRDSFTLPFRE